LGRIELGLLARHVVGVDALDRDTNRPERHDEQDDGHRDGDAGHVLGDVDEVQTTGTLCEGGGAERHHSEPRARNSCNLTHPAHFHYCILRERNWRVVVAWWLLN